MSRRLALIIGNSEYDDPTLARLVTPGGDAADLATVLGDPQIGGFEQIETLLNQPLTKIRRAIAHFFARRKPDDLLLLYFSGHGVLDDRGRLFLAVKDTEHEVLRGTALSANFITDEMDNSRSKRQVLILDCCHSGAFTRGAKGAPGHSVGTAPTFEGTGYGRVVLTATDSTQYAWEGDQVTGEGLNSIFTRHLVHGLRSGEADKDQDGRITLDEWYDYAYAQVVSQTSKQTPRKWSFNEQGEVVIARNPHWRPPQLPPELQQAIESPFKHVRLGAVQELGKILRGSDKGWTLAAQAALERLQDDDSRAVSGKATEILGSEAKKSTSEMEQKDDIKPPAQAQRIEVDQPAQVETEKKVEPKPQPTPQPTPISSARPADSKQTSDRRPISPFLISGGVIVVGFLLVFIIGTIISMTASSGGIGLVSSPTPRPTPDTSSLPKTITDFNDSPMILVPAGPFEMGSDADVALAECQKLYIGSEDECQRAWYEDEEPQHTVNLDAFYIDQYEVTNAQFATFLDDQGNQSENDVTWLDANDGEVRIRQNEGVWQIDDGYADHPVIEVTWYGAQAYCNWRAARLPTEAEWEKAARGTEGQLYPWGETFDGNLTNFCDSNCSLEWANKDYDDGYAGTAPVGSYPEGVSPYGVYDMAGNVWEWVADWYDSDYYSSSPEVNPTGPSSGSHRVVRGGAWLDIGDFVRAANRNRSAPAESLNDIGFRCARSP